MTLPETLETRPAEAAAPAPAPPATRGGRARRRLVREVRSHGPGVVLFALVLLAWEYLPGALGAEEFIFPPLHAVLENFTDGDRLQLIIDNWQVTMREAGIGLAIGVVLGVVLGFVLAEWRLLNRLVYPYIVAVQALPKVAIAPLFVIWFGFGDEPKILIAALLVFFPVLINTMTGVAAVDAARHDLFASLVASRWQIWSQLLFRTALPHIFAAIEMVVVFAILGAIVGEFISAQEGLGVQLQLMQNNYDTAGVFAILIVLVVTGVVLNAIVRAVRTRVVFWR